MYQIQNSLQWTLPGLKMPPGFQALQRWTNFLDLNLLMILPVSCIRPFSYYDTLAFMTGFPIALSAWILLACEALAFCSARAEARRRVRVYGFGAFLLLLFLIFPSVSAAVLRYFKCVEFEGVRADGGRQLRRVLLADYNISCDSRTYRGAGMAYAMLMVLVYPVGIPSRGRVPIFGGARSAAIEEGPRGSTAPWK